ncbi:MAG: hypothetical protein HRU19_05090 [Pseudobacteriovorax sp.]|nr:hypothetical protein [Pseudobacteriovorax sp.]
MKWMIGFLILQTLFVAKPGLLADEAPDPQVVANLTRITALSLDIVDDIAYVALGPSGLSVVDVSNPERPRVIGSVRTPSDAYEVKVVGNFAYVAGWAAGLVVVDISNPRAPRVVSSQRTPTNALTIDVVDGLIVVGCWNVNINGGDPRHGIVLYETTGPRPNRLANFNTPGWAGSVFIDGSLIYVADGPGGLLLVDSSDPENPRTISSIETRVRAYGVAVRDDIAFVADNSAGLAVIDASDPRRMVTIERLAIPGASYDVSIRGDYAWVASTAGVFVVDIANPNNVELLTNIPSSRARDVKFYKDHAYIADSFGGLKIVQIAR